MAGTKQRARQVARARYERQQAKRRAARAKRRQRQQVIGAALAVALVIAGVVFVMASTGGSGKKAAAAPTPTPSASATVPGTCGYVAGAKAAKSVGKPPATGVPATGTLDATLTFGTGVLKASLLTAKAPCTVNSFSYLAGKKYFDKTTCHRLTTSGIFVLQCGDPTATGSGGPGYQFGEENLPAASAGVNYPAGTLAMANAGAGTNGSQFFIVYKDTTLPASYTVFGTVTSGLDVVTKIAAAGVSGGGTDGKPATPVPLVSVTVKKAA